MELKTLELIYADDQYEYISDPVNRSEDNDSLEDNSAYVFSEQGDEATPATWDVATPTLKEEFELARNNSYQEVEYRLDNVYEEAGQL